MKIIAALLSASLLLAASDTFTTTKLSLDDAIARVKAQNLEIKIADYELQSAQRDADGATAQHFGRLDFIQNISRSNDAGNVFGFKLASREANFGDFGFADFDMADPNILTKEPRDLNYPEERDFYQSKLVYQLPLYTGGMIVSYGDITDAVKRLKQLDKKAATNEKVYETRKAFYDMALIENSVIAMGTILENINTLEEMTASMIDEGYAKQVDLLEVQAKRADVERLIKQMRSNKELLYHYLSFLLNETVSDIELPAGDVPMLTLSNDDVLSRNIDIQKASAGLQIREEMVDVSMSGFLPMIGFQAEGQTADDTFLGDASDHASYTVGVQLKWNLFSGGGDYAGYQKAKIEEMKTQHQLELARKGIALKMDKIRTEIESFDYEINSLSKELELARQIYHNYEGRYREQLASMSDVIIKQSEQIQKVLQLQAVKNERNKRVFAFEKLANGVEK